MSNFENRLFINGEFVVSHNDKKFQLINPTTTDTVTSVYEAGVEDVDKAVEAAGAALESWSDLSALERGSWLYRLADRIEQDTKEIAHLEALSTGKPIDDFVRNSKG